jgi:hypothetical protein
LEGQASALPTRGFGGSAGVYLERRLPDRSASGGLFAAPFLFAETGSREA